MGNNIKNGKSNHFGIYDRLTGVYNRVHFEDTFQGLDKAENLPISVIICDLNSLKLINDLFGRHGGDKLLIDVGHMLKNYCRCHDIIGRWGSDEFILALPKADYKTTIQIVSQIKNNSKKLEYKDFPVNISLGAATKIELSTKIEEIIKSADDLMYRNKLLESNELRHSIVNFLEKIMFTRHYQTEAHTKRLRKFVRKIGSFLNLPDKELEELALVAALHDIGKISIPLEILNKPGSLTGDEWNIIKRHPETGFRISRATSGLEHISDSILSHHERWDGTGYPQGLRGSEIPLYARIVAVADSFDVMIHGRSYKRAMSSEEALAEVKRCSGSQFDPNIVGLFMSMFNDFKVDTSNV
jgi:diguanylate cyclase (GGDEF)-like protein